MQNSKKIITTILIALIAGIILIFTLIRINQPIDNTKDAEIYIGNSKLYSEEDIKSAINIALARFKNYPATLRRIYYDEEKSQKQSDFWAKQYNASECIVLYSDFKTYNGEQAATEGFQSDSEYGGWQWVFVRNGSDEDWQLKTWGY